MLILTCIQQSTWNKKEPTELAQLHMLVYVLLYYELLELLLAIYIIYYYIP